MIEAALQIGYLVEAIVRAGGAVPARCSPEPAVDILAIAEHRAVCAELAVNRTQTLTVMSLGLHFDQFAEAMIESIAATAEYQLAKIVAGELAAEMASL